MGTEIICPNCNSKFALEDVMTDELKKQLRSEMIAYKQKKEQEYNQLAQQIAKERAEIRQQREEQDSLLEKRIKELQQEAMEKARLKAAEEYQTRLQSLEEERKVKTQQLNELQKKELDLLREKNELEESRRNMEMQLEKRFLEEKQRIEAGAASRVQEKFELERKEWQVQMEQQRKRIEEMKKKIEQGSMQLQGEVQELALEDILNNLFPFDDINEVGKGVKGADVIQTVKNGYGQLCGTIIYESKRTSNFSDTWIEKLKTDMRSLGADIAVIVTQAMPREMNQFGQRDNVWICSFAEVKSVAAVLRDSILKVNQAIKTQENFGDKKNMLYAYFTSNEFHQQWNAIREGFLSMKLSISKERDAMERLWKAREKQLEKILINATHIQGSVEGISGGESLEFKFLEEGDNNLPE